MPLENGRKAMLSMEELIVLLGLGGLGGLAIFVVIACVIVGIMVGFLPSIIAFNRKHTHRWIIFLLNVFLSWTLIVWVILFIWALVGGEKEESVGRYAGRMVNDFKDTANQTKAIADDMYSELEKIGRLKELGTISEEEFADMKQKILDKHKF